MSVELDRIQRNSLIGPYRIVRGYKGRGGMACVFEVEVHEQYRQPDLPHHLAILLAHAHLHACTDVHAHHKALRRYPICR